MAKDQTAPFPNKEWDVPSCDRREGQSDAVSFVAGGVLLCFLGFPLADAVAQLLFALERSGGGRGVVLLLRARQSRAEKQVADPGLDQSEG